MKPSEIRLTRRDWCLWGGSTLMVALLSTVGCTQSAMRSQSPEDFERVLADVRLIGDVSVPFGFHPLVVRSVGLVVNLANTGGDTPPSAERAMLVSELQRHNVEHPEEVLLSPTTSLVVVQAALRPGLEKGDRFDLDLIVPPHCETTSLAGGVLLPAPMREMAVLGGGIHQGATMGIGRGPLMEDPLADLEHNPGRKPSARIVEGGLALKSRPLGLLLKEKSFSTSRQIGNAINARFYFSRNGIKTGAATPKTDGYVELVVHPRYKENVLRYIMVIRSLAVQESPAQRQMRLELLERQLLDPVTSATAALRLEAIGAGGKNVLKKGIASSDIEIRFYAAEALAYLDDSAAAAPLASAARDESAFRARALAALSAMDDPAAYEELVNLLDVASAETRYGAFRALWAMNSSDPLVRGEKLSDQFSLHRIPSKGPVMVHVTRAYRPEIVIFGPEPKLRAPLILNAGKSIVIRDLDGNRLSVSRFAPGVPDQKREISCSISDLVRAIISVGGTYPDVVQALSQAKASGALGCRFEIDAVPRTDRIYVRSSERTRQEVGDGPDAAEGFPVDGPAPGLFPVEGGTDSKTGDKPLDGRPDSPAIPPVRGVSDAGATTKTDSDASGSADHEEADDAWPLTRRLGKMLSRLRGSDSDD